MRVRSMLALLASVGALAILAAPTGAGAAANCSVEGTVVTCHGGSGSGGGGGGGGSGINFSADRNTTFNTLQGGGGGGGAAGGSGGVGFRCTTSVVCVGGGSR